jgi:4a-hydroxytetrahydrobiopterin dehydratase
MNLSEEKCVPCSGKTPRLSSDEAKTLAEQIPDWKLDLAAGAGSAGLYRYYKLKNFAEALKFVNQVAEIAEKQGHHPDIHLINYNQVSLWLTTHAIRGLSHNDFIVAAKISLL